MLFVEMVPRYHIIREGLIRTGKGESSYRVNGLVRFAQATLGLTFLFGLPSAKAWRLRARQITPTDYARIPAMPEAFPSEGLDLSDVKDERVRKDLRSGSFQIILSASLRSELNNALKRRPEPTHEELGNFLKIMESIDADFLLRPCLKHIAGRLPPFPPGREPILNSLQQKRALADVARLSAHRAISRKDTYRKVAKKYGVHWRTIQNLSSKIYKQDR